MKHRIKETITYNLVWLGNIAFWLLFLYLVLNK
jgi:hypothetical protein